MSESNPEAQKITVLGIGNTMMGDDGAGVLVAESLIGRIDDPNVEVVIGENAGMALIKYFRESDVVIVLDAMETEGAEPGALFRFNPQDVGLADLRSNSVHGMGVPQLVANTWLLGANPEIIVFAVQVGDVRERDCVLTEPVEAAAHRMRELVLEELASRGVEVP